MFEANYSTTRSILNLQVARSALKAFTNLVTAKAPREALSRLTPSSAYLATLVPPPTLPLQLPSSLDGWQDHFLLQRLLSLRAALTVARVAKMMEPQGGKKFGDLSWECVALSEAVVEAFLAKVMVDALAEGGSLARGAGSNEQQVLKQVVTFVSLMLTPGLVPFLYYLDIANPFPRPWCSSSSTASKRRSRHCSNSASSLRHHLLRLPRRPQNRAPRVPPHSRYCAMRSTSRRECSSPNWSV